jgi:hypothetical protein
VKNEKEKKPIIIAIKATTQNLKIQKTGSYACIFVV